MSRSDGRSQFDGRISISVAGGQLADTDVPSSRTRMQREYGQIPIAHDVCAILHAIVLGNAGFNEGTIRLRAHTKLFRGDFVIAEDETARDASALGEMRVQHSKQRLPIA
jgi:hypothetical protein